MYTIVGLGNPGEEYRLTRHNVGWLALDTFIKQHHLPSLVASGTFNAWLSEGILYGSPVGVLLPKTYMNNSGHPTAQYLRERSGTLEKLIVVHDEIDLPFGTIRISVGRNGGGHNGVASLIAVCGSPAFIRVRVGVAKTGLFGGIKRPKGDALAGFVLGTFTKREQATLPALCATVSDAVTCIVEKGVAEAMNRFN